MEIHTAQKPAQELGERITEIINTHDGDMLCLLAGGSALDVVEFIQPIYKSECRTTFIMGDERVSGVATENNFLQMRARYSGFRILNHTIDTSIQENEKAQDFSKRIMKKISSALAETKNLKIISVLGVGTDGHTAGIFPMGRKEFIKTYPSNQTYVPVILNGSELNFRASFTPAWILENTTELFLYAAGKEKLDVLYMLIGENKSSHERPVELVKQHINAHVYTDQQIKA